ncbi:MAG: Flp pilus assembly protein TadC [halophilic archaeon J07HX64]|jgi:Flp pilus assembly protein TadC|nr:MAG: Flp pilus assembly protein TadC [halophilic archaeon J07HX64]
MVGTATPVLLVSLVVMLFIFGVWIVGKLSPRVDTALSRIAMTLFQRFVSASSERQRRVEAAFLTTTYRNYAAKTMLFAVMAFIFSAILGVYILTVVLAFLEPIVAVLSQLPVAAPLGLSLDFSLSLSAQVTLILLIVGSALLFGSIGAAISYWVRWWLPSSAVDVRKRNINEGLTRATAFMYALSRGGMEFPQILRTFTTYQGIYGETSREMSVAVREIDMFGRDIITALRRMSSRTPSEQFKTFSENLTSVLQSGGNLSQFLEEQFERFRKESEERQEDLLELLATIAEGYVTVLVAGMLFFITILLIFGLTISNTLTLLQLIIYAVIPLGNAVFALLVQQQLDQFGISGVGTDSGVEALRQRSLATPASVLPGTDSESTRPDGGYTGRDRENSRMLALHDRLYRVKNALRNPIEIVFWNPTKLLWVTVPIGLLMFLLRAPAVFAADGISIRILDDLLVQSVLFVILTYAIVRFFYKRHITRIEKATPEFLERLASLNEAGMSIVQAVDRVRGTDIGVLSPEVDRIWRDLQYGSTVDDAFVRFGRRVRTTAIARVVTLLTNAMRASGNMGPVIRIAAEQHRAELSLRRQRRQEMFTYLIVIYIAFLVFIVIIVSINEMLVPNIPESSPIDSGELEALGAGGAFGDFGGVNQASYTLVFFHASLIQAICAGFVAGQLGEGSLRDGAKHAAVMLAMAYFVFILLTSPIAAVLPGDVPGESADVVIDGDNTLQNFDEVSLSEGGFVAVYADEDDRE